MSLQPQPPLELPVLPEEEEEIQGVRWCRCYFDRLRFYQNAEWLFLAGSLSTGRRKKVVAWALHVFIPGGYRGAPLFPSGSDVWEPPAPQKCNTTFFRVSRGVMVLQGSKYSCVQKKKKKKSLEAPQIWMGLHRNWSLKRLKSPPLHHCRAGEFNSTGQASVSRTTRRFIPNVPHPETTGCPRNRPWACVCCVCGVSCERCSVWVRGKVFVSPSPGPSVCCVSVECAWCCGSSTGRRPDPGPERRGPHLETQDGGRHGSHIRWQDKHLYWFEFGMV